MSKFGARKTAQGAIAIATTVVGVLTLTACQNGEDGGGAATASPSAASSAPSAPSDGYSTPPTQSSQPTASAAPGGAGGAAKAGQTFKIGEATTLPFSYGSTKGGTIELAVTGIEQGKAEDLAPLKLGDKVNGMVPYYIRYSVKNVGTVDLSYATVGHIKGHLGDGSEAQEVSVIGKFEKCQKDSLPKGFGNGQSTTGCVIAMAPSAATKVASAEYWGDPYTLGKGLMWK
ncbi:hypothetical protein [Streptomyces sp. WAC06614]|uniref:hypothetical protein n=1 Tax=Streptomyces sp. WAC06614 TaxID=2487416 RepID=UPI000F796FB4|nr:hypothetical protein [Streptomyces sp. WAC06614]RSS79144.1 hypothetical protein EF918_18370 [Streptomyces sp. WAC06614]